MANHIVQGGEAAAGRFGRERSPEAGVDLFEGVLVRRGVEGFVASRDSFRQGSDEFGFAGSADEPHGAYAVGEESRADAKVGAGNMRHALSERFDFRGRAVTVEFGGHLIGHFKEVGAHDVPGEASFVDERVGRLGLSRAQRKNGDEADGFH